MDDKSSNDSCDVFISGELIDLVVPNERAIYVDRWYAWFNDPNVTAALDQGIFPNSPQKQEMFLSSLRTSKTRIALLIKPKDKPHVVGVVSLSNIDHVKRQADFAMVIGRPSSSFKSAFYGLEAKCLMTEHAFEVLGIERINTGQSTTLKDWQRWQILLGYKIEGLQRKAFRKGYHTFDVLITSCLLKDYLALRELRGGRLWPGYSKIMDLIRCLPQENLPDTISGLISETVDAYYQRVRMI